MVTCCVTHQSSTANLPRRQRIFKKQKMKFKMSTKVMGASLKPGGGAILKTEPVKGGEGADMEVRACGAGFGCGW